MRILLALLFALPFTISAKEQPVKTTISAVKVFLSGAEVTRTGKVELMKGTSTLLLAGLSEEVDPANIQVSGSGVFTILGVQHRLNYLEEKQDREEVTDLKARIKAMEADIAREQSLLAVLEKEDARLAKNDVIAGDNGLALEQLRTINDYLQQRQETLGLKRIERLARLDQLNEDLQKLKLQLNQLQGKKSHPTSEILVEVSANATVETTLTVKYLVRSAGWSPNYDIRVNDITKPLQVTYKAQVYQNSGEDWDKVQLALSSGEPNKDAIMPEMQTWRLDFGYTPYRGTAATQAYNVNVRDVRGIIRDASTGDPLPFANVVVLGENGQTINGATSNVDGYYAIAIPPNGRSLQFSFVGFTSQALSIRSSTINVSMAANLQLQAVEVVTHNRPLLDADASEFRSMSGVVMLESRPSRRIRRQRLEYGEDEYNRSENSLATTSLAEAVIQRATNFEFAISVPYSIPSDGQNHQVGVQEQELAGTYRYYCTPKLDLDAFLFAQVTGWEGMNLLAGPAYIYFEGTFVGESLLDLGGVGDTLDINLGRDKGVTVQRTKRKDFSRRSISGGKRTESVGWEVAVRNNKPQPVDLVITDQYPIAARDEIEVRLDESGGATVNAEKGFLTWKVRLEPRTNQQWNFGYSVKVPKEQVVVLE